MANQVLIRNVRRKLGLERRRARLGDGNGRVYVPGRSGYVYVRFSASDGNTDSLTVPTAVRLRANIAVANDAPVIVSHDKDGVLAVFESDFGGVEQSGGNPLSGLSNNVEVNGYIDLSYSPILRSQPVGGSEGLSVSVLPFLYVSGTTLNVYMGEKLDLTSYIPATTDYWCLVGLFLKTDNTVEVISSTAKSTADPLGADDIQECITGATALSVPICCWQLTNGQTEIVDTDKFFDARQWINIPQTAGSGSGVDRTALSLIGWPS